MDELKESIPWHRIAPFLLFLAVALGAFGAHGLEGKLTEKGLKTYQTGIFYHFIHALSLFVISLTGKTVRFRKACFFFLSGIILFSGFCYLYAVTNIKGLAMVVPFGGLSFLIGWSLIFFAKQKPS